MAIRNEVTALIATFQRRPDAERFVEELKRARFRPEEFALITPPEPKEPVEERAAAGAVAGGGVGLVAGAAAGLVPGVGPIFAGGLLTSVLGGAAAGVAAGSVIGALVSLGVSTEGAHAYEAEYHEGKTLVVVQALGRGAEALAIADRMNEEVEQAT